MCPTHSTRSIINARARQRPRTSRPTPSDRTTVLAHLLGLAQPLDVTPAIADIAKPMPLYTGSYALAALRFLWGLCPTHHVPTVGLRDRRCRPEALTHLVSPANSVVDLLPSPVPPVAERPSARAY